MGKGPIWLTVVLIIASFFFQKSIFSETTSKDKDATAIIEKGNMYFDIGKLDYAIKEFEKALAIEPDNRMIYGKLVEAYFTRNRLKALSFGLEMDMDSGRP